MADSLDFEFFKHKLIDYNLAIRSNNDYDFKQSRIVLFISF